MTSAYLRLLIFLPAILIPACASSSPAFLIMYSAYSLNKMHTQYLIQSAFCTHRFNQPQLCGTVKSESESHSIMSDSLPWTIQSMKYKFSPGQNTGVGSLSLLQWMFPTQGSHSGLSHCKQILYQMNNKVCD